MLILCCLLLLLASLYALQLSVLRSGFESQGNAAKNKEVFTVTVVVAARNEEACISDCLAALAAQSYPAHRLEFIIVDDNSTDQTAGRIQTWQSKLENLRLIRITERYAGIASKKYAVAQAIEQAIGEIILTTDADCKPGEEWVAGMVRHFDPSVGLVAGYNPYRLTTEPNIWQRMLALDYFAMAAVAAASSNLRYPISCTGGNLAFRKSVYHEVDGYGNISQLISGDDDLFLERVREQTDWQIRYSLTPETFVVTRPPASLTEFVNQRTRYASKGRFYSLPLRVLLITVYAMNLLIATGLLSITFSWKFGAAAIAALVVKSIAEAYFLAKAAKAFEERSDKWAYALAALLHPFYIAVAGLRGLFMTFEWKGERHAARTSERPERSPLSSST